MSITHYRGPTVKVEAFFDGGVQDISADIRYMTVQSSQRSRLSNTYDPGRLTMQLDNSSRKYDPLYAAGPLYGDLRTGVLVQVTLTHASATRTDPTYTGWTDRFTIDYDRSNKDSVVTLTCVDSLGLLNFGVIPAGSDVQAGLEIGTIFGNLTSSPIGRALTFQGYSGNLTATPSYPLGAGAYVATMTYDWDSTRDHNLLEEYRRIADLEQAPITGAYSGEVWIWPRHWFKSLTRSKTSQVTVGTGGLPFQSVKPLFDGDEIITACSMVNEYGDAVVAIDTAGEAVYGTRWPSVTYSNLPAELEILNGAANTVVELRSLEEFRLDELTIKLGSDADWLEYGIDLQLHDRITVVWTPTGVGSAISADYFIDGVTHTITPGDWTITYSLMACSRFDDAMPGDLFIVGSSLVGGTDQVGF